MLTPYVKPSVNTSSPLLLGIIGIFTLLIVIMAYYIIKYNYTPEKPYAVQPAPPTHAAGVPSSIMAQPSTPVSQVNSKVVLPSSASAVDEVFNVRDNNYTLDQASAVCKLFGAKVATIDQLKEAHAKGADWCNVGWTKDGIAAYPIQRSTWEKMQENEPDRRDDCGTPGINVVNSNPNLMYGVNCYGIKPEPRGLEKLKTKTMSDADIKIAAQLHELRRNLDNIQLNPWNEDTWRAGMPSSTPNTPAIPEALASSNKAETFVNLIAPLAPPSPPINPKSPTDNYRV